MDIKGTRRSLIKLVGSLSRYAARTEAREAGRKRLGRRARATLRRARALIRQGNRLGTRARRGVSPRLLRRSVRSYRAPHLRLLPLAHPTFNRRR